MNIKIRMKSKIIIIMAIIYIAIGGMCVNVYAASNPYSRTYTWNGTTHTNCTWWAWQRANDDAGVALPGWNDAWTWANLARNAGYTVDSNPTKYSIAVWPQGASGSAYQYGHVAYVEEVNGSTMTISEYGYGADGSKNVGVTDTRGYGGAPQFIHLKLDNEKPVIHDARINSTTMAQDKFMVEVVATDNIAIDKVKVYSWPIDHYSTSLNFDEMVPQGNNTYLFCVNASDHQNLKGIYAIHVIAYDTFGNETKREINAVPMGTSNIGNYTITTPVRITMGSDSSKVLGISGTDVGSRVVVQNKNYNDNTQLWKIDKVSGTTNYYKITNVSTGLVLDVKGANGASNTEMELFTSNNSSAQKFHIMYYNGAYRLVPECTNDVSSFDWNGLTVGSLPVLKYATSLTDSKQTIKFEAEVPITASVNYTTHVQNVGWQSYVKNGAMAGTSGKSLRIEGIKIKLSNTPVAGGIQYRTHVQNIGWQDWVQNDIMAGTSGKGLRLEAIQIKLTGKMAEKYDVYYRVHAQNFGWLGWAKNGASAGTQGYSYRLEAIEIKLVEKGKAGPTSSVSAFYNANLVPSVNYTTHVQNVGWQSYVKDGAMSGTSGKSLRLEGIKVKLTNMPTTGGIQYRTHVQNIGWQSWVQNDTMAGTSGKSLRLEAIQIKLTGKMAEKYDVYYRVHAQNFGWLGWAKNGASAGTQGYSYRLEGIQIKLVKKGSAAPGSTANAFKSK